MCGLIHELQPQLILLDRDHTSDHVLAGQQLRDVSVLPCP